MVSYNNRYGIGYSMRMLNGFLGIMLVDVFIISVVKVLVDGCWVK